MESLKDMAKRDNELMTILKVNEIRHVVCGTDKGVFSMTLRKDGTAKDYVFVLDAVPVEPKQNKQLLSLFDGILFEN